MRKEIKSARDFLPMAQLVIKQAKLDIIRALGEDAKTQVQQKSNGQLVPSLEYGPDSFTVGILLGPTDPQGIKTREINNKTQTFQTLYKSLNNKAYVLNLLGKG